MGAATTMNGADVSREASVLLYDAGTVPEDSLNLTLSNGSLAGSRANYEFTATSYGGAQNADTAQSRKIHINVGDDAGLVLMCMFIGYAE